MIANAVHEFYRWLNVGGNLTPAQSETVSRLESIPDTHALAAELGQACVECDWSAVTDLIGDMLNDNAA